MRRRSRSATPEREGRHSRSRSRSPRERSYRLPEGVTEISESDYFLKSDEFRIWLKDEKDRYMDELSSEKSRRYFRKFVKAWNRGKLSKSIYQGAIEKAPTTGYKWNFASKTSRADSDAIRAVREEVESSRFRRTSSSSNSKRVLGPTLPSRTDRVLAEEEEEERRAAELQRKRKRERVEDKDRVEDMVGPKEIGKAGTLEKKRVKRENDKAFREKGDDGFMEADDKTLMGGGDSFKDRIAQRDANRLKWQEKKAAERGEKTTEIQERQKALREKDRATMDAFMKMAKERFG
ncbi:hypothetical protein BDM02DRAFT_3138313 [Thelephora ganbajun]|uniref:Uncharacterized protein n=1 Tax=Thelephora ganbajun TaxID=370292 RepID=A0ACB6ZQ83_THEGA|nr:hypothetical protein BDM02DRAFT_3138313 [Thelephora ganbajun]